jgi:hypothetical protein
MSAAPAVATGDLRRATLTALRRIDFRAATRDLWADESALWDRLLVSWAGLDEAAWRLPGAARSDAGGPDWSLAEHVGHLADWQELAIDYVAIAEATGRWPSDDDFDGGDFDRFNERRRAPWTTMASGEIIDRLMAARPRLLGAVHRFTVEELRGDASWGWMYMTLHGHYLGELVVAVAIGRGGSHKVVRRGQQVDGHAGEARLQDILYAVLVRILPDVITDGCRPARAAATSGPAAAARSSGPAAAARPGIVVQPRVHVGQVLPFG